MTLDEIAERLLAYGRGLDDDERERIAWRLYFITRVRDYAAQGIPWARQALAKLPYLDVPIWRAILPDGDPRLQCG